MGSVPNIPETAYYYTNLDTFKLILQYGTLRFKESTESNDKKDTKVMNERIRKVLPEMIDTLINQNMEVEDVKFAEGLFNYIKGPNRVNMVACLTRKPDSRFLWDSYTMNRLGRESSRYNGVCIEIKISELLKCMQDVEGDFDYRGIENIIYGNNATDEILREWIKEFHNQYLELKDDPDQKQNLIPTITVPYPFGTKAIAMDLRKKIVFPTLDLLQKVDCYAPYFKDGFWREEEEVRAVLSINKNKIKESGACHSKAPEFYYFDVDITERCIQKVILGPEFSDDDQKVLKSITGRINYEKLVKEKSVGTGVITNQ